MKQLFSIILIVLLVQPQEVLARKKDNDPQELKVMSYNIRYGLGKDGTNSWNMRCPATIALLEELKPDVFGVQEALDFQVNFIDEYTKEYRNVGVGREDGRHKGEHMSIFWNKKTVSLLKWDTFWLSETPEVPSKGWDAECRRTATWALMKDKKTGKKFYFVNTHLDHKGTEAQKNGLMLIVERIAQINPQGYPMVLVGDFNIKPDNRNLRELDMIMHSTRRIALKTDNHNTFNGWGKAKKDEVIDFIYVSGFSSCPEYRTVTDKFADKPFVSDHYPIISRLIF